MNIFRPQIPYVFRPPRYSALLAPLLGQVSARGFLRGKFRVRTITAEGVDRVAALVREGHAVMVSPNHADHADPHVLLRIGRRHGLGLHFMAAREGFEERRLNRMLLQRIGAFSIDREGADISAIKTAVQILREGRFALVVFPEGEIYHHHEQVDPLNEGVPTIILRASEKLAAGRRAYLVPTAMRYAYDDSVVDTFSDRLTALEKRITWKPRPEMDVVDRIYRLGRGLLAIKEVEFLGQVQSGDLVEHISNLRNRLVGMIEQKHLEREKEGSIPARVKALRGRIRRRLIDSDGDLSPEQEESLYDDLDTLFVAVQLYSYPGQYLREEPTPDRIAETLLKLEEDVLGEAKYGVPRDVHVRFGAPIDVQEFLRDHSLTVKTGAAPLTARLGETLQSMLDQRA
jgi:1-acyl-sn-glycerol-3-phosphate acyltransferase